MKFSKVDPSIVEDIQVNAGVVLRTFDPANPTEPIDSDIIAVTTGGITANCVPTYSDYGSDIDNVPNNTLELKRIDSYDCNMGFTILNMTPDTVRLALGAADVSGNKITPRSTINPEDFENIWFAGDLSDGGCIAILLKNALSTSGFALKTTKNGKGNTSVTLTGHISIADPEDIPMEFYIIKGSDMPSDEPNEPDEPDNPDDPTEDPDGTEEGTDGT